MLAGSMATERRHDASGLGKARRDARGFLVVPARPARTGVLTYRRADGTTQRELRLDADVFSPESLATYEGAPVTVGHQGTVTPANARSLEVGVVAGSARRDGAFVAAELSIRDDATIARIESGELVELSAGYSVDLDPTPGVHEGERYDAIQRRVVINHVALLGRGQGRSGADVRLRLDADSAELVDDESVSREDDASQVRDDDAGEPRKETRMAVKVRLDGVDLEFSEEGAAAVAKLQSAVEAATKRADTSDAVAAGETAKATKSASDLAAATDPKVRADAVKARVSLERAAGKVLGDADLSALSDRDVRVQAIAKVSPEFVVEGRSDDAIATVFDVLVVPAQKRDDGLLITASVVGKAPAGGAEKPKTLSDARAERAGSK